MKRAIFIISTILVIIFPGCENSKEDPEKLTLTGSLVSHSDCKIGKKSLIGITEIPDTLSCVNYSYDSLSHKLDIEHINAGFNCCPDSIYCKVALRNDTITITEYEAKALCDCDCLYDMDMMVNGVASGKYFIRFIEPYCGEQEKIIFSLDLSKNKTGSFCVKITIYPGGM
jgi:hypothetical protein